MKIKLVAIAKDEAAYLGDWISHHLYFGIDLIDVYVNNTSDNTSELSAAMANLESVRFLNGDSFFQDGLPKPQERIYQHAYDSAHIDGVTHVLCLDIDEFWTPKDFNSSIGECINSIDGNVISFEWFEGYAESKAFLPAFRQVISGKKLRFVKSLYSTGLKDARLSAHNIYSGDAAYRLADNSEFKFKGLDNGRILSSELCGNLKPYFVLHRMYRSETEYVSLLGRGRPKAVKQKTSVFKDNRTGYFGKRNGLQFEIADTEFRNYDEFRRSFFDKYSLYDVQAKGQKFVLKRFESVLKLIADADDSEIETLKRLLTNVKLIKVKSAYDLFLSKDFKQITKNDIDLFRNAAIALEDTNVELSLSLMKVARRFRPEGATINEKISLYTQMVG
ncbi:hypothetical protein F9L16_06895 [Agarivorans sp. B2Z047]|uniref:glycosyltransferase family 2 protein n=1 Tax=Agarivorans sp. B2Z047 TaxID=2652721 RepID=UPI00128D6C2C|nr:glycosyltransferase family 2 protein [Agarivorans sp. B2Z047]MPW28730.1 hypothetical protein [Agarivorans sp. B2Z047]UQN41291.1 glycosyltransferase family 2 protein [Agarivorans sp. B2Z047]